jgi:uncharacterized protein (DUF2141 family)
MFKKVLFICVLFWTAGNAFADNIRASLEINNVAVNRGLVYVAVYSNENDYKNERAYFSFIMESTAATLTYSLELPEEEYVVSAFQDTNNNGKLGTTIFGIPTEPVGKTNYNLRGAPGNFKKLKMPVNSNSTVLTVNMGRVKPLGVI